MLDYIQNSEHDNTLSLLTKYIIIILHCTTKIQHKPCLRSCGCDVLTVGIDSTVADESLDVCCIAVGQCNPDDELIGCGILVVFVHVVDVGEERASKNSIVRKTFVCTCGAVTVNLIKNSQAVKSVDPKKPM